MITIMLAKTGCNSRYATEASIWLWRATPQLPALSCNECRLEKGKGSDFCPWIEPAQIPRKMPQTGIFGIFGVIFLIFSGYFGGVFREFRAKVPFFRHFVEIPGLVVLGLTLWQAGAFPSVVRQKSGLECTAALQLQSQMRFLALQ